MVTEFTPVTEIVEDWLVLVYCVGGSV